MIIFYNKKTGSITGTIEGRIHLEHHLKMWVGKKGKTNRLIIQWKAVKDHKDKEGNVIARDYSPDTTQKDIFVELDQKPSKIHEYKIDIKTKLLVKKQHEQDSSKRNKSPLKEKQVKDELRG